MLKYVYGFKRKNSTHICTLLGVYLYIVLLRVKCLNFNKAPNNVLNDDFETSDTVTQYVIVCICKLWNWSLSDDINYVTSSNNNSSDCYSDRQYSKGLIRLTLPCFLMCAMKKLLKVSTWQRAGPEFKCSVNPKSFTLNY